MNAKGALLRGKLDTRRLEAAICIVTLVAASATLTACTRHPQPAVSTSRLVPGPLASSFTVLARQAPPPGTVAMDLVYAEPQTRTLVSAAVFLRAGAEPALDALVLDRIAEGADASPDFGSHAYARIDGTEYLGYRDRAPDGRLVLKQLSRPAGAPGWSIDLLEPPGRPLCFLAAGSDVHLIRADGGLLDQRVVPGGGAEPVRVRDRIEPQGQVSVVRAPTGDLFTLFDAAAPGVIVGRLVGATVRIEDILPPPGVTPGAASHARMNGSGELCLFLYDARALELVDLVGIGARPRAERVTRARDVGAVFAHEEGGRASYLYTERTRAPDGKQLFALSLVQSSGGSHGEASYRRLHSSEVPYRGFQAHVADGELRVVALTDALLLVRTSLWPDR